jgi:hypothetical protein
VFVHAILLQPLLSDLLEPIGEGGERVYATPSFGWGSDVRADPRERGYVIFDRTRWCCDARGRDLWRFVRRRSRRMRKFSGRRSL